MELKEYIKICIESFNSDEASERISTYIEDTKPSGVIRINEELNPKELAQSIDKMQSSSWVYKSNNLIEIIKELEQIGKQLLLKFGAESFDSREKLQKIIDKLKAK